MSDEPVNPTDEEVLAEAALSRLEFEADALCAELLKADQAAATLMPGLIAALDANATAYSDARDTWYADMQCGDLPPDDRARDRAIEMRKAAGIRMYEFLASARGEGLPVQPLIDAMMALWEFLDGLDDDTRDQLAEQVAGTLGDAGPRYVLGF